MVFYLDASGNPVTQSVVSVTDSSGNPVTGNLIYSLKNIFESFLNISMHKWLAGVLKSHFQLLYQNENSILIF